MNEQLTIYREPLLTGHVICEAVRDQPNVPYDSLLSPYKLPFEEVYGDAGITHRESHFSKAGFKAEGDPRYIVGDLVYKSGTSRVYRGEDLKLNRPCSIKTAFAGADEILLEREALMIAALDHPHILKVYDFLKDSEGAYVVSEWLEGANLLDELEKCGPFDYSRAATILTQIANALDYCYARGMPYTDIKAGNAMLTEQGVKIIDFGVAYENELAEANLLNDSARLQITSIYRPVFDENPATIESGIYSLAILFTQMVTEGFFYDLVDENTGVLNEELFNKLTASLTDKEKIPRLRKIITKAVNRDTTQRYHSFTDFATDIASLS